MKNQTILDDIQVENQKNYPEEFSLRTDHSEYEWNQAIAKRQTFSKQKKQIEERRESLKSNLLGNVQYQNDQQIFITLLQEQQEQNLLDQIELDSFISENEQEYQINDFQQKPKKKLKKKIATIKSLKQENEILTDTDTSIQIKLKKIKIQKQQKKVKKLGNLLQLLQKWFKGQTISEDNLVLSQIENQIFLSIIKRKFKTLDYLDSKEFSLKKILDKVNQETTRKRPEENYKFIFKRTLKNLKEKFQRKFNVKQNKNQLDILFYQHFFGEISQREKIPLQHFYHPNSSRKRTLANFTVPKTINNYYIGNIAKSTQFVYLFKNYVQQQIIDDYSKVIDTKLQSLVEKWEKALIKNNDNFKNICLYIQFNKKCKLPWNSMEIQSAGKQTMQLFTNIFEQLNIQNKLIIYF